MEAALEVRKATASSALNHPLRIRILVVANERPISPVKFVDEVLRPRTKTERKAILSGVSYHFRALDKAGCIEQVEEIARRGSQEHVYKATARAFFSDEDWEKMSPRLRCTISTAMLQSMVAEVENAMLAHTFDARTDRWFAWTRASLDDRGWAEMLTTIAANFAELERIREESEARLEEVEGEPIPVVFGMLGFEAPPAR
jgi:hypothetical protein